MNKLRNAPRIMAEMESQPKVEIKITPEIAGEPFVLPSEKVLERPQFWKPFSLGRYPDDADWLSRIENLSGSIEDLARLLDYEVQHGSWLNAYLLAAGIGQIIEDDLHMDPILLGRASRFLEKAANPMGQKLSASALSLARSWVLLSELMPRTSRVIRWRALLFDFIDRLAEAVMVPGAANERMNARLVADEIELLKEVIGFPPSLQNEVNRLPSCFRSFDQRPEDVKALSMRFASRWPDKKRIITVVGVRTSGSYLAPLYAAELKALGYDAVQWITLRPGVPLLTEEAASIRKLVRHNGLALICDDPPSTGNTLRKVTHLLEMRGLPRENILLLLQLFEDADCLPSFLNDFPRVITPWSEWQIQKGLEADAVGKMLSDLSLPGAKIVHVRRLTPQDPTEIRRHVNAAYTIDIVNLVDSHVHTLTVQIRGVGLGYFGEHSLAVSKKLPEYSAHIIALRDGLVYEELPESLSPVQLDLAADPKQLMTLMENYVLERNAQMPCREDLSLRLKSRNAVWEVASNLLSSTFGQAWYLLRMPLLDREVRQMLKVPHPSVIDGDVAIKHWFINENPGSPSPHLIKMNQAERDFSHEDLASFDPAYDLASLALAMGMEDRSSLLRTYYQQATGDSISAERWMLHQLVYFWDLERHNVVTGAQATRKMGKVLERYYSELYFQESPGKQDGAYCVLDIDGVLETNHLGFASLSPASARSMHALQTHGYRILLASGRSLDEVKERCVAYHLAGGIAEYGAALFDTASGRVMTLLTRSELGILDSLRKQLSTDPRIVIDPEYENSVRAYSLDSKGRRTGLDVIAANSVLSQLDLEGLIIPLHGKAQTDFVFKRINKAKGIKAWMSTFDSGSESDPVVAEHRQIAMAVGDDSADLAMLKLARLAFAPAHASSRFRGQRVQITTHPYQRGLEQAATRLLGHKPGDCPICRMPSVTGGAEFMRDVFSLQEDGTLGMIRQSFKLLMKQGRYMNGSAD